MSLCRFWGLERGPRLADAFRVGSVVLKVHWSVFRSRLEAPRHGRGVDGTLREEENRGSAEERFSESCGLELGESGVVGKCHRVTADHVLVPLGRPTRRTDSIYI